MKTFAFALMVAGCLPDVDQYPIGTSSNTPAIGQVQGPVNTRPDAAETRFDGGAGFDGNGLDGLPTAFDAGPPTDVGSPPKDVLFIQ